VLSGNANSLRQYDLAELAMAPLPFHDVEIGEGTRGLHPGELGMKAIDYLAGADQGDLR
jgi:hypothetical protein